MRVWRELLGLDRQGDYSALRSRQGDSNEFLRAHRKLEQQQAIIDRQQKQVELLAATVQKVSKQMDRNKHSPKLVAER